MQGWLSVEHTAVRAVTGLPWACVLGHPGPGCVSACHLGDTLLDVGGDRVDHLCTSTASLPWPGGIVWGSSQRPKDRLFHCLPILKGKLAWSQASSSPGRG